MEVKTWSLAWSSFREATLQLSPHRNHTSANLLLQLDASKLQISTRAVFYVCLDQRRMLHRDIDSRPAKRPRSWWLEGIKAVCRPRHTVTSYIWLHSPKKALSWCQAVFLFKHFLVRYQNFWVDVNNNRTWAQQQKGSDSVMLVSFLPGAQTSSCHPFMMFYSTTSSSSSLCTFLTSC